jgi:CDP-diacylglycerol pyrophosphatase
LIPAVLLFFTTLTAQCFAGGNRDILWNIVTNCLDPAVAGYDTLCRWPIESSTTACRKTTGLWNLSSEFVILRDVKMCDCPADKTFVHGLAIPRTKVTGSEDPNRPAGIWQFAWDTAVKRIESGAEIALVVNPPGLANRGQDQLHLHLVRLNDAGRRLVAAAKAASVRSLADVWRKADQLATQKGLAYYGVLVAQHPAGGFVVHVDDRNLEDDYTVARCP